MNSITISGKIIRLVNHQPISKLYVEAWDTLKTSKQALVSTYTDNDGDFTLVVDENYVGELYKDHYPDVYFKVFAGTILLASTETSHVVNLRGNTSNIVIEVDFQAQANGAAINYVVKGQILQANLSPAAAFDIQVLDKGIVNDAVISKARTDTGGNFQIAIENAVFLKEGKQSPDVFLRITQGNTSYDTSVRYNASAVTEFKEVIGGGIPFPEESEFDRFNKKISPLINNIPIHDIKLNETKNPYGLISQKTGINDQQAKWMVLSLQMADITKMPAAFFYGLLRARLVSEHTTAGSFLVGSDPTNIISILQQVQKGENLGQAYVALTQQPEAIIKALAMLPKDAVPNAFEYSVKQGIIPAQLLAQKDQLLKQWTDIASKYKNKTGKDFIQLIGKVPMSDGGKTALSNLFDGPSGGTQTPVNPPATASDAGHAPDEEFTQGVINNMIDDPQTATTVKEKLNIKRPEQLSRLAKLSESDWKGLASSKETTLTNERIHDLVSTLQKLYPTSVFAAKLKGDSKNQFDNKEAVVSFFENFPEIELHQTNLEKYFKTNAKQINSQFEDPGKLKSDLKKIQRVFRLSPNYETTKVLLQNNLTSSQSIYNLGRKNFVAKVAGSIPQDEANKIFSKAERSHAAALAVVGELKSLQQGSALNVLPNVNEVFEAMAIKDFPDIKTLFEGIDNWDCKECKNVYSAAAYTSDLLKFLNKRGSTTPLQSAKQVLFKRRKDIGEIDLNCDNTNTAIPYIDLVCEILEDTVASTSTIVSSAIEPLLKEGLVDPGVVTEFKSKNLPLEATAAVTLLDSTTWFVRDNATTYKIAKTGAQLNASVTKQTHGSIAERTALPEYINYTVYDTILKNEKHPFTLPFDLSWEETRAYLDKIGIDRAAWMQAFQNKTIPSPTDLEIAGEALAISPSEVSLIITADPLNQALYWGGLVNIDTVSVFLQKAGIEYTDLLSLLLLKFINPTLNAKLLHHDTTANLDNKSISNLDNDMLDRTHRFLRLWRKLGWQMWELDKVLSNTTMGSGLNGPFLVNLEKFVQLKNTLNKSVEEVIAYYEDLNTKGTKALYNALFRNKIILNPLPDAFRIELVTENPFPNPAPPAPDGSIRTITAQIKSIGAVVKLKEQDVLLIQSNTLADDNLSLSNLSIFFRIASLINKLKLSAKEYYLLLEILNTGAVLDLFADVASTQKFIDIVAFIRSSKLSVYELYYLLLHKDGGPRALLPTDAIITDFLSKGRSGLQKISDDLHSVTGLPDEVAKALIGKIPSVADADSNETIQIFNGTFTGTTVARDAFLDATYGAFIDTTVIKTKLNARDAALPADKDQKTLEAYQAFDDLLLAYLSTALSKDSVYQLHTDQFKIADDITSDLLEKGHLNGTTVPFISYWFDPNFLKKDNAGNYVNAINNANFPNLFKSYQAWNKIALLQARMPLNLSLIDLLIAHAGDFGIIGFDELPVAGPVADSKFAKWQSYVRLNQFSALYPDNDAGSFAATLSMLLPVAATEADFLKALSNFTLFDLTELTDLKTQLALAYPADYLKMETYTELDACMNLLATPAVPASQIGLVIKPSPVSTDAISVNQFVKSKYENDQWLNTSANIQAAIRNKKRDALVAYFTNNTINGNNFKDDNELYSYYLLDTEMGSKEVTTRILQANLSIQLFVQRCLMNLESEIVADAEADDGWLQWDWMKYFQVWVANRKVFLYPENWIEPELRLDKSSFFQELENDLAQNEMTTANAEDAFLSYLEKLDNVARLEVNGFYYEEETYTLHVFARTYDDPHIYYYRKYVEDRYWTPWEKIDLEITTTQVVPIVINRRIYLYWPTFREQTVPQSSATLPALPGSSASSVTLDKPTKYWEMHLAVSEYRNNKWTPRKISKSYIQSPNSTDLYNDYPQENFSFVPIDLIDIADRYLMGCFINPTPKDDTQFVEYPVDFFDLGSCHGTPEVLDDYSIKYLIRYPIIPQFERSELKYLESEEAGYDKNNDALTYQQGNLFINHIHILEKTPNIFRAPQPAQLSFFDKLILKIYAAYMGYNKLNEGYFPYPVGTFLPFFYQDKARTFFVPQEIVLQKQNANGQNLKGEFFYSDLLKIIQEIFRTGQLPDILKPYFSDGKWPSIAYQLKFTNLYHPHVCFLIKQLYMNGIDGFMKRDVQLMNTTKYPEIKPFDFAIDYSPTAVVNSTDTRVIPNPADPDTVVNPGYPKETMDFNAWGSYAEYNWELFYHAPMLIAEKLSNNQQFEDAMHWYHYIFNPTDSSSYPSPQRFWNTKPFFVRATNDYLNERIDQILNMINSGDTELIKDVDDWRRNPFQPHRIAQFRTVAYQKTTVMKYMDNLIAWGDNLFRTDTRENINTATQMYILAAEILGPKPKLVPNFFEVPVLNYNQLETKLDAFSNALIDVENFIPYFASDGVQQYDGGLPSIEMFYFCLPQNEKLLTYWDTVADRLFKIRNSMNIDGIERSLALFDPPIDPGLLVKAAASGISLGAAIAGLNAPLPNYRFNICLQKATDLTNEVKGLGSLMLSSLEKRDAEAMALLRSTHEINMLEAVKRVKKTQVDEANANIEHLNKTKAVTQEKLNYYSSLEFMNTGEIIAFALSTASTVLDASIAAGYILAGGLKFIPQFIAGASGFGGSPHVTVDIGGKQFGDAAEIATKTISAIALALDKGASLASTQGSYQRRKDEWDYQVRSSQKEIAQIDQQIVAAQIRLDIAQKEMDNQQLQIDQTKEADVFMRNKFTNQQLYDWMITQLSTVYFQSYQLAFDMAKRAEKSYRYDLGIPDSNFIQFGYWDSLKKGLLSGEQLLLDLKRMDSSFYEKNKREFEITKHISLNQIDPLALLKLKQNGVCFFDLPEEIFDIDYPGHYFRRVKSVSVSIPCIVGPYNNVNFTLTILKSRIRVSADAANVDYSTPPTENDPGFTFNFSSIQQMVTSNAQNDSGMFETVLRDERYLPFEGHGAISQWKLELNTDFKNFDANSINDVILHVRYTARQGGAVLGKKAKGSLSDHFDQIIKTHESGTGLFKLISMKSDFSTEFHQLLYPAGPSQQVSFNFTQMHVPYWLSTKNLEFDDTVDATVFIKLKTGQAINLNTLGMQLNGQAVTFAPPTVLGELKQGSTTQSGTLVGTWTLSSSTNNLDPVKIDDIMVLVKYKIV
jgi:hypothetical protein